MELQFRTVEFAASVFTQIKTIEWIVSTLGHVVTKQALGENIQNRKFPLEKETTIYSIQKFEMKSKIRVCPN